MLFATLVPAVALTFFIIRDRNEAVAAAQRQLAATANRIAEELNDAVRATAQLQYGLVRARDLDTDDRVACSDFLASVLKEYPQYTGILTIQTDGELFCDSLRTGRKLNLTDRRYFQDALGSNTALAVEPAFGRLTGIAVLQIASAARSDEGRTKFVLLASLNLEKFMDSRSQGLPFDSGVLALVDGTGTLLTWHPEGERLRGTSIAGSPLDLLARGRDERQLDDDIEIGGVARIWRAAALPRFPEARLAVLVGVSSAALSAAADLRLRRTLAILAAVCLLAIVGGWMLADRIQAQHDENRRLSEELERRVAERTRELEEANRAKSDFMANVTHELRTPLNSIIGFAELLKEGVAGPLNAQQATFAADILAAGLRQLTLVKGILEMSRLDAAGAALERAPVEIGAALEERVAAHRKAAEARRVSITLDAAADAGSAELDPQALCRMLDALIDNAIKFNREGGQVTVSAHRADGALEIAVTDTGIGIAREDLGKLFKPLVQLDAGFARRHGGVGLGLTLARRLAELHGGTVEVASEPGKGSTFTLRLPTEEEHA